jgi:predicted acylesterase/phospholipase RssA
MRRVDIDNFKDKKVALVLSGGVVKAAAWHIGVGLALDELGFTLKSNQSHKSSLEISTYVGSSAGALISLYFASGYSPRDIINAHLYKDTKVLSPVTYRDMLSFRSDTPRPPKGSSYDPFSEFPFFIKSLMNPLLSFNGFFSTSGLKRYLEREVLISNKFEDYKSDVFVIATQLDHSRKVVFSKYKYPRPYHDKTVSYYTNTSISDGVAASMSVPPFYSPSPVKNPVTGKTDYYIDGEIRETLSTHVAVDNKCDLIISSWTHTPYHFQGEIGSLVNYGLPAIATQAIYLMIQKKIVSSRAKRASAADIIDTVNEYCKGNRIDEVHRRNLLQILERKLNFNPNIHYIDIFPTHDNYAIFFKNSFSLNPDNMRTLVKLGFQRTMEIFRRHEWES